MTVVSELIKELQQLQKEHGDLPVIVAENGYDDVWKAIVEGKQREKRIEYCLLAGGFFALVVLTILFFVFEF